MATAVPTGQAPVVVLCAAWPSATGSRMLCADSNQPHFLLFATLSWVPALWHPSLTYSLPTLLPGYSADLFAVQLSVPLAGDGGHWLSCPQALSLLLCTLPTQTTP